MAGRSRDGGLAGALTTEAHWTQLLLASLRWWLRLHAFVTRCAAVREERRNLGGSAGGSAGKEPTSQSSGPHGPRSSRACAPGPGTKTGAATVTGPRGDRSSPCPLQREEARTAASHRHEGPHAACLRARGAPECAEVWTRGWDGTCLGEPVEAPSSPSRAWTWGRRYSCV